MARPKRVSTAVVRVLLWLVLFLLTSAVSVSQAQTDEVQAMVTVVPNNHGKGEPGATVIYQHTVKNVGTSADTYDLTTDSSEGWSTTISPEEVTLNPNQQANVLVTIVVSLNANQGDVDLTTVTATSQTTPGDFGTATDTTIVPIPTYLPMVSNNSGPATPDCVLFIPPPANPQGVDLVVTAISLNPNPPRAGQNTTVRVTVKNQGTSDVMAGNNFLIDFYDNPNPEPPGTLQPGVLYWGVQGVEFTAGTSLTFSKTYNFVPGFHHLYAQIDTDRSVTEANESNNVYGCLGLQVN